jgi:peptide/nickel transport system substrate-binding protein
MAGVVRDSLAGCGIEVRVDTLPVNELYEPGPGGLVFGRQFDLTFVAWQPLAELDCGFYQSWRIPAEDNQWIGTNIAGLVNDNYDKACADASLALPESSPGLITAAEEVFLSTLPAIPLFGHPDVMVIRRAQCGNFDFSSAEFFFENLDEFTGDASCP